MGKDSWKFKYKVWYIPEQVLIVIGELGTNIYERELLRTIFCKYFAVYRKDNRLHKVQITIKSSDVADAMSQKTYFDAMKALRKRNVIEWNSTLGRKGCQHVSIITNEIVTKIASKEFKNSTILFDNDKIDWI